MRWGACNHIWYLLTDITHLSYDLYELMRHRQAHWDWLSLPSIKNHAVCHIFSFLLLFACVYGTEANHLNVITMLLIYWNNYLEWQSLARTPFSVSVSSIFYFLCTVDSSACVNGAQCALCWVWSCDSLQYACLLFTDDPNLSVSDAKETQFMRTLVILSLNSLYFSV